MILTVDEIVQLHEKLIAATDGSAGIRDIGLLESAVLDGNKRAAVASMLVMLRLNGISLACSQQELIALGLGSNPPPSYSTI